MATHTPKKAKGPVVSAASPLQVKHAIAEDFKIKGLTHAAAGKEMGVSRQVITSQLSGEKYFSERISTQYAKAFGYNTAFLRTGIGTLTEGTPKKKATSNSETLQLKIQLETLQKKYNTVCEQLSEVQALNTKLQKNVTKLISMLPESSKSNR